VKTDCSRSNCRPSHLSYRRFLNKTAQEPVTDAELTIGRHLCSVQHSLGSNSDRFVPPKPVPVPSSSDLSNVSAMPRPAHRSRMRSVDHSKLFKSPLVRMDMHSGQREGSDLGLSDTHHRDINQSFLLSKQNHETNSGFSSMQTHSVPPVPAQLTTVPENRSMRSGQFLSRVFLVFTLQHRAFSQDYATLPRLLHLEWLVPIPRTLAP
jgi:hypothetical protein